MKRTITVLSTLSVVALLAAGCRPPASSGTQFVLLGDSAVTGAEAVQEANNKIANAAGSGCKAISVGGYGVVAETLEIGIPVLVDCPAGTTLLPDGTAGP